jgi:pimeloyl-ACP methyl ester carboxylesterase
MLCQQMHDGEGVASVTEPHAEGSGPDSAYTRTWCPSGEISYATLSSGVRLRYLKTGSRRSVLILLHTVRTQLDHFQFVIPRLSDWFTVYAIDLPGMGWSDIQRGADYTESTLRAAVVEFVDLLQLDDITLAGESMGATISLTASTDLDHRVRRVIAFNPYDYSAGVGRANTVAALYTWSARLSGIGMVVARMENKPVLGHVLSGGLHDRTKLPAHYLSELRRVGRRPGYARVSHEVFRSLESMIAARDLYGRVGVPVTLVYGEHDWSRESERDANAALLQSVRSISLPDTGHFSALERPDRVGEILLENAPEHGPDQHPVPQRQSRA